MVLRGPCILAVWNFLRMSAKLRFVSHINLVMFTPDIAQSNYTVFVGRSRIMVEL